MSYQHEPICFDNEFISRTTNNYLLFLSELIDSIKINALIIISMCCVVVKYAKQLQTLILIYSMKENR